MIGRTLSEKVVSLIGGKKAITIMGARQGSEGQVRWFMTMEQMIDLCAQFTEELNKNSGQNLTVEQMKEQMRQFFPYLKPSTLRKCGLSYMPLLI